MARLLWVRSNLFSKVHVNLCFRLPWEPKGNGIENNYSKGT